MYYTQEVPKMGTRKLMTISLPPELLLLAEEAFAARFKGHPLANVHAFAGFDQVQAWEREFLPAEDLDKYRDSIGYQPSRP